jgi:cytochrome P450
VGNPDQLALLRARPDLIPNAVEELLRYDSPVERATQRFAAEDVRIGDDLIPQGGVVFVALGSANRDEAHFPQADRLDVTRGPQGHLGFGHGLHFCLGAPLARLEARIAFETLLRRLPIIELDAAPDELGYRVSPIIRGVTSLPIRFTARQTEQAR